MGTTTERVDTDADAALTFVAAELPEHFLDAFMDGDLVDTTDELAALFEVRRQLERYRDGLD